MAYRRADASPESFDAELTFYSADGYELFSASLVNALPFAAKLNQNGTQSFIIVNKLTAAGLENHLLSYADTGQLTWTTQLPSGPPIGLAIKPFADRIAIAVDRSVVCYSGAGQPLWQHEAQGVVQDMDFLGQSDQVTYSSQKVSVFSFQKQSLITTLSDQGTPLWQYEVKGTVPHVASNSSTLRACITNNPVSYTHLDVYKRQWTAHLSFIHGMRAYAISNWPTRGLSLLQSHRLSGL